MKATSLCLLLGGTASITNARRDLQTNNSTITALNDAKSKATKLPTQKSKSDKSKSKSTKSKTSKSSTRPPVTTTNSPTPNNTTSTSYPTMTPTLSDDEYPPLTWLGVEGCTIDSPCPACSGDCDESSDCLSGLECYKRTNSDEVPGCTSGGAGDIPGADYCYDPSLVSNAPTIAQGFPTYSPVMNPTLPPQETSIPVPLTWVGVNGCTPTQPCDACFGDCDADTDCQAADSGSTMACYKRADGDTSQVPGCLTGGDGDIPGADYCYVVSSGEAQVSETLSIDHPEALSPSQAQAEDIGAYFIRSQARSKGVGGWGVSWWCVSGALSPNYDQVKLEECIHDDSLTDDEDAQIEKVDQLWTMDTLGYIHSVFDYDRCMMVSPTIIQSGDMNEIPIDIGPCNNANALNRFYFDSRSSMIKLQGYDTFCVNFGGGDVASNASPVVLGQCQEGWDFVLDSVSEVNADLLSK